MMQDFRLASVLLVPFVGGKISPQVRLKSFPQDIYYIYLFQGVAQPDGLDG